eukprot:scaffold63616_cov60-Phaeocystis_antarctica.AAC.3
MSPSRASVSALAESSLTLEFPARLMFFSFGASPARRLAASAATPASSMLLPFRMSFFAAVVRVSALLSSFTSASPQPSSPNASFSD